MECSECIRVFEEVGNALNAPIDTVQLLELVAGSLVKQFHLKGCHFRLLSRDRTTLDHVASHGLSQAYLDKGRVEAERSVADALDGETVMVTDCATDPRIQYPEACAREGIVSMLTIPLKARGQVIGVVRLSTNERREFSRQELQILEVVASFCAAIVVHWMFHSIVANVTEAIRSSLDLDALLTAIMKVTTEDLRAKGCFIVLADAEGGSRRRHTTYGLSERFAAKASSEPGEVLAEVLKGSCVLVLDSHTDPRVPFRNEALQEGVGSILYIPLMVRDTLIGALGICTHRAYEFSEDEVYLLRGVGDQCAFAIRSAQMYATARARYQELADDFQQWFERYQVFPHERGPSH
jgi:GAF domain-containing protein